VNGIGPGKTRVFIVQDFSAILLMLYTSVHKPWSFSHINPRHGPEICWPIGSLENPAENTMILLVGFLHVLNIVDVRAKKGAANLAVSGADFWYDVREIKPWNRVHRKHRTISHEKSNSRSSIRCKSIISIPVGVDYSQCGKDIVR
jgi:hypothetical protein